MTTSPRAWQRLVLSLAVCAAAAPAVAASTFGQPDPDFRGTIMAMPAPAVLAGGQATLMGRNFRPGQTITFLRGTTPLGDAAYTVEGDGTFKATIAIPADAATGPQPIVALVTNPDAALVVPVKVSPDIPLTGAQRFAVQQQAVVPGLYQAAYSARQKALYLSSTLGMRPLSQSTLVKVNPATLAVQATGQAPAADAATGYFGVYGVAVDDAHGTVWATNTRQNTVAVYRQDDLALVKQFEAGLVPHAHEIAIDESLNRAYVSAAAERPPAEGQDRVYVFDTQNQQPADSIQIRSGRPGQVFNTLSLALDASHHKLYVTSMTTAELAVIDTASGQVEKVIALPTASAMGVAVDPARGLAFVASPSLDGVLTVDTASGKVLHTTATGAGTLKIAFDASKGLVYAINRGAGTVTALTEEGQIVANLGAGPFPNHVVTDGQGNAFVVSKTRGGPTGQEDPKGDPVLRLRFLK